MTRRSLIWVLLLVLLIGGGYATYEYLKQKPPSFLIELFTKTKEPPPLPAGDQAPLTVPEGFAATIYAREVPGARVMTRDQRGTMLVSLTKSGKVVALPDEDGDGRADRQVTILEGLMQPHGILVHCVAENECTLYVAETGALKTYAYEAPTFTATYQETLTTFPTGNGHYTRTLLMHPDGNQLLVSVGSSCNVCVEEDPKRATVQAVNLTTGGVSTFATGLRNTVFMALHPVTGAIWGTDNGRDVIGDDIPPDEVNIIEQGKNYGWPYCYGQNMHDADFDKARAQSCTNRTPAHIDLPAHSAALGIAFVPEEGWPDAWFHDALIAYHGSWNRSEPTGYKVVRVNLDSNGNPNGPIEDFVTGFLAPGAKEDEAIGRPVGVMAEPGGVVYISDDRANAIYRVALTEPPR